MGVEKKTARNKLNKSGVQFWLNTIKGLPSSLVSATEIEKMTGRKPIFNLLFGRATVETAIKPITSDKNVLNQILLANKTIMALDEAIENNVEVQSIFSWWLGNRRMRYEINKVRDSMMKEVKIERRIKAGEKIGTEEYLKIVTPANAVQLLATSFATATGEDEYLDTDEYKKKVHYVNFKIRLMADLMKYPKDKKNNKPNVLSVAAGDFGEMTALDLIKKIEERFFIENPFTNDKNNTKTSNFLLNFYKSIMKFLEDLTPLWHSLYHFKMTDIVSLLSTTED